MLKASGRLLGPLLVALTVVMSYGVPTGAQDLTQLLRGMSPSQIAELLRQNPQLQNLVRGRIAGSGLQLPDIRDRLAGTGLSPDLLDAFLEGRNVDPAFFNPNTLRAISLLGVNAFGIPDALLTTPDTTALRLAADSLRADSTAREAAASKELRLFGLDVLRQPTTRFQPLVTGPVDGSYRLGPGDILVLLLTGGVELTQILEVTTAGFVLIPRVGQIFVNSLSLDQFRSVLYDRLGSAFSGISRAPNPTTQFDIVVAKVRVQTVRVLGEVARPGSFQVAATGGVLSALYEAGGLLELGNFRGVEVRRGKDLVATIDLYEYLLHGTVTNEVRLQPGDVIFVPIHGPRVTVAGEVMRPGIYELKPGETLSDLIALAGGLTPTATTEAAIIDRILPPSERPEPGHTRTVLTVDLQSVYDSAASPVQLQALDSVTVLAIKGGRRNTLTIEGSVWQPGTYQLEPGGRLWDLIETAGGLRPETYEGRVQVLRTLPDSSKQLLGFSLDTSGNPAPEANPLLRESDVVTVFSKIDFRPVRSVTVVGAVRQPGIIEFSDSMTLRDAILLASGLTEDAYLLAAEVSRVRPEQGSSPDSLALILRVPLDSSYVFDPSGYIKRPAGNGNATRFILNPYDNIFVRRQPGWEVQRNVSVTGEVEFPGVYTLAVKSERLARLLERAGGLTTEAYPDAIQFFRREGAIGRVAIDLPAVLRNPGHRDNLALAPGDSIHIPRYIPTVRVQGAVNFPSSVTYVPGRGISYYLDAAGGVNYQGDKGKAFVQQPNGLTRRGGRPLAGAVIMVPEKDPNARGLVALLPFFSAFVSIIATTATLIIAISN